MLETLIYLLEPDYIRNFIMLDSINSNLESII